MFQNFFRLGDDMIFLYALIALLLATLVIILCMFIFTFIAVFLEIVIGLEKFRNRRH